jgi:predicted nucleic acid-binding protein
LYTSTFTMAEVVRPLNKDVHDARQLSAEETAEIQKMFQWPWVRRIDVDHRVVRKVVELAREFALSAADAIHAASAIVAGANVLQHWERKSGFGALSRMIPVENPRRLSYSELHVVASERIALRTVTPAPVAAVPSSQLLRRAVRL